jgi:cation transport regulator ChaC
LEGWPIKTYIRVSWGGERVTIYSWETIKCDRRLCRDEVSYLHQIERSLRQLGMTEEQINVIIEEVKRRLG